MHIQEMASARMRPRPGSTRPNSDTSGPTISADTTVPMPNELMSRPSVKKR